MKLWAGSGHINNINIAYIRLIRFFMCDLEKNMQLFVSELTDSLSGFMIILPQLSTPFIYKVNRMGLCTDPPWNAVCDKPD